ncbi:MAG: DEAD/DEAH box helicase [Flavobacteriia bacterium]|jgi:ATP-dependent RNA helicase RhlE|nr:DEAD/DEAH box helicase [Flavobacteriia bacterium]
MTFHDLSLIQPLLTAIERVGYTHPTPIQAKAIPPILNGQDLMGCAQTGTGKTAAFAIPILQRLTLKSRPEGKRKIRTLILTPTRELAIQIEENIQAYGKDLDHRHAVIFGGVNQHSQVQQVKNGIDILVATPGRLIDLHQQGYISLQHLEIFVLDEADRMLDMGFIHDVNRIIKLIPTRRQTLFFSATMPKEIKALANTLLTNPEMVVVTPISSTAETVEQSMVFVETAEKKDVLLDLLTVNSTPSVLVFTRTKHGADRVVKILAKSKITAAAIHGNKSQNARQNALNGFKQQKIRVLVATDIAARGIDIDDLSLVVNYDLPNVPETYVHRIGRTGRAGANGQAISFCNQEERAYLKDIQKLIGRTIDLHPSYC